MIVDEEYTTRGEGGLNTDPLQVNSDLWEIKKNSSTTKIGINTICFDPFSEICYGAPNPLKAKIHRD